MTARLVQLTTRMSNRQQRQLNMGRWVFTLCLGRPLERFRVLASGRVSGLAHGKHSSSKRLLRHKVLMERVSFVVDISSSDCQG